MRHVFQSFWLGPQISPYQLLSMQSFLSHGHRYILYCYDRMPVVPGVELRDAADILSRNRVFFYKQGPGAGSVSAFSNLFRYKLLRDRGGWWTDTDVICLGHKLPDAELVMARESPTDVGTAVLRLPQGHPLAAQLCREAEAQGEDVSWGQAGPQLLTRLVLGSRWEQYVLPSSFCFPISYHDDEYRMMLDPGLSDIARSRIAESPLVHLWNEVWRRINFNYFLPPPGGSLLAEFFETYLPFERATEMIRAFMRYEREAQGLLR
jgi:Glycosyltransferase sugar-binding region containing DXD motif